MAISYSPLRYPGGKSQIYNNIKSIIQTNGFTGCHYVEPFAGGAGIAIRLLFEDIVTEITINDYDYAIYSFWDSIVHNTNEFLALLDITPITIEEWKRQRQIYENQGNYSNLEIGFSTFFLNRTNRSGIINAGPIGGLSQNGNYSIDCRFNKIKLSNLIKQIAMKKNQIHIENLDAKKLIRIIKDENSFFFIDPPYYNNGKKLYTNFFVHNDHQELADIINETLVEYPWIVTYDICPEIKKIYHRNLGNEIELNYSVQNKKKASEFLFYNKLVV